jgi:hypothetical protein
MTREEATKQAALTGKPVRFSDIQEIFPGQFEGEDGKVLPCGCTFLNTVLADGSIGWGEWEELCDSHC